MRTLLHAPYLNDLESLRIDDLFSLIDIVGVLEQRNDDMASSSAIFGRFLSPARKSAAIMWPGLEQRVIVSLQLERY